MSPADASAFETTLAVHQRAVGADGTTVFARAMIEHNLFAAARVYKAISFPSLATLLGIDAVKAERIAAKMVAENRLAAGIDQVDNMLVFAESARSGGSSSGSSGGGAGGAAASGAKKAASAASAAAASAGVDALLDWDAKIKDVCMGVNTVVENIAKAYPAIPVAAAAAAAAAAGGGASSSAASTVRGAGSKSSAMAI